MKRKRLVVLDFDFTLFDAGRIREDIGEQMKEKAWLWQRLHNLGTQNVSGPSVAWLLVLVKLGILKLPADNQYIYPDVPAMLGRLREAGDSVAILSTGYDPFQRYKIGLSPVLSGISAQITPRNKGYFLQEHTRVSEDGSLQIKPLSSEWFHEIVIIDDMPATFVVMCEDPDSAANAIKGVRMRRPDTRYSAINTPDGVDEIADFDDLHLKP